ncbi:MAG: hypothetical protein V1897_16685, partial [Pseudomonadota bacterium]
FSDRQYALWGTRSDPSFVTVPIAWYPNEGRTYFMGLKMDLDYERMRVPTIPDLTRMHRSLYGSMVDSFSSVRGAATWMRNLTTF